MARTLLIPALLAFGCSSGSKDSASETSGGAIGVTVSIVANDGIYEGNRHNSDDLLNPGETLNMAVRIDNTGEVPLWELQGSVSLVDDRLTGWDSSVQSLGKISASGREGTNNNRLCPYGDCPFPGNSLVTLAPFDAGPSGTRINGTADIWIACGTDQWDEVEDWCRRSGEERFPVYQGPVDLEVVEPPTGPDAFRLSAPRVESDTSGEGVVGASERVTWEVDLTKIAETDVHGLVGRLGCTDPYLSDVVGEELDGWGFDNNVGSKTLSLSGTVSPDVPDGHTFTLELSATDFLGDRHELSTVTPEVQIRDVQLVFQSLRAIHFIEPEEGEVYRSNIPLTVVVENIGDGAMVDTFGDLRFSSSLLRDSGGPVFGGDISAGGGATYQNMMVDVWVEYLPQVNEIPLALYIEDALGQTATVNFEWLLYTIPVPVVATTASEASGDGDGLPEPGEALEVALDFMAVAPRSEGTNMRAEVSVSSDDPNIRFSGGTTHTWVGFAEGDTRTWDLPLTALGSHPGGTVTLTLQAEVYADTSNPGPQWTYSQEVSFEVE